MTMLAKTALTALTLVYSMNLSAQQSEESEENVESQEAASTPYEVVITSKPSRAYLRDLIEDVEEDFFAKFNEFNDEDMYDMYCYKYTPAMTHIRKRACEPLFMINYRSKQSSDAMFLMAGGGNSTSIGERMAGVYLPTEREMRRHQKRYYETLTQKLEEAAATNQEIGEIANVMMQLKSRLENYNED